MVVETPLERSTGATAGEFNAKLDDVRSLVIVLKAISFKAVSESTSSSSFTAFGPAKSTWFHLRKPIALLLATGFDS